MAFLDDLQQAVLAYLQEEHGLEVSSDQVLINPTRSEFEGDYTVVVFPFVKALRQSPQTIGEALGQAMVERLADVIGYNVIKGFVNLELSSDYWVHRLYAGISPQSVSSLVASDEKVLVEFSSPNTNKPLHLGHVRNILLGWSVSKLLEAVGHSVKRIQIINDRGISICQSMLAWKKYGQGETPTSSGIKGDHLVGKYYVAFNKELNEEYQNWQQTAQATQVYNSQQLEGESKTEFFKRYKENYHNTYSSLGSEAREMLRQWEAEDEATRKLWKQMNAWVYNGFDKTYDKLGVTFDQLYYESETYILGKEIVVEGLDKGIFYQKEDGSIWVDLEDVGWDQKLLLRGDGTSVYMTQDLGTARQRYKDHQALRMVYIVGNEQNYHFDVLFELIRRLGEPYADGLYHLSYGMISLPEGKMKSREGTVVDADDLIAEVIAEASAATAERGTLDQLTEEERKDIIRKVALAALKFFIIKVQPKKGMIFNPSESVDLQGQTGPYIQYAYVRIQSVLRRAAEEGVVIGEQAPAQVEAIERALLRELVSYPELVRRAAEEYDPSQVANYCYQLAKLFNKYWNEQPIFSAPEQTRSFRLALCRAIGEHLQHGMDLLGIEMPEKM